MQQGLNSTVGKPTESDGTYGSDALTFLQAYEKKACYCKSGGCANTSKFPDEPWAKGAISARKSSQAELGKNAFTD